MENISIQSKRKKIDVLGFCILMSIFITTTILSYQLSNLRTEIHVQSISKVQTIDNDQLNQLCNQLATQWKADNYSMYIYQPNGPVKTHKELASTNDEHSPLRLALDDYRAINQNKIEFGSMKNIKGFENNETSKAYVRIPIYQYSVIIAELYLFYNDPNDIDERTFNSMIVETQIINKLLK